MGREKTHELVRGEQEKFAMQPMPKPGKTLMPPATDKGKDENKDKNNKDLGVKEGSAPEFRLEASLLGKTPEEEVSKSKDVISPQDSEQSKEEESEGKEEEKKPEKEEKVDKKEEKEEGGEDNGAEDEKGEENPDQGEEDGNEEKPEDGKEEGDNKEGGDSAKAKSDKGGDLGGSGESKPDADAPAPGMKPESKKEQDNPEEGSKKQFGNLKKSQSDSKGAEQGLFAVLSSVSALKPENKDSKPAQMKQGGKNEQSSSFDLQGAQQQVKKLGEEAQAKARQMRSIVSAKKQQLQQLGEKMKSGVRNSW